MYPKDETQRILAYDVLGIILTVGTPSFILGVRPWEGLWSYIILSVIALVAAFFWSWWFWYNLHYIPAKYVDDEEREALVKTIAVYDNAIATLRKDVDALKKGIVAKEPSLWSRVHGRLRRGNS